MASPTMFTGGVLNSNENPYRKDAIIIPLIKSNTKPCQGLILRDVFITKIDKIKR